MDFLRLQTPVSNPVLIFAIVLFIILLSPLILKRFKIPGIVGLFVAGMFIGPNGLNIIQRDSSIILLSTVGLLYIMFLAGLELDLIQFRKNRHKGVSYGIMLFSFPILFSGFAAYYFLDFTLLQSTFIALLVSTNTLVSYPIVIRLGLSRNQAVATAVAGAIITDTLILILLGVIENIAAGHSGNMFIIRLAVSFSLYLVVIFYVFPYITKLYFKNVESDQTGQYIFVMAMAFTGSYFAQLIGLEPIIGAFLTGLSLNKMIPNTSVLMGRIEFIGNSIFIPFFLISVGMLIDLKIIFNKPDSMFLAFIFYLISSLGILLAVSFAKKIFNFTANQKKLIFGLNSSHAAATIAIAIVGYNMGILNETFINATVILILISCVISSFIVEKFGKRVAVEAAKEPIEISRKPQRILVPFSNPSTVESLFELALLIKDNNNEALFPMTVVTDDDTTEETILKNYEQLQNVIRQAQSVNVRVQVVTRVDTSVRDGIARAIKELLASCVILGSNQNSPVSSILPGNQVDNLLNVTNTLMLVTRFTHPINTCENIKIVIPENAELEIGCSGWVQIIYLLSKHNSSQVTFIGFESTLMKINAFIKISDFDLQAFYRPIHRYEDIKNLCKDISVEDICVIVNSRVKGISYNLDYNSIIAEISDNIESHNVMVIYPEQSSVFSPDLFYSNSDVLDSSLISKNINIYQHIRDYIKRKFKGN